MISKLLPYKVIATGLSDVGLVRENNEDSWAKLGHPRLFVLADGMGGHQAGEVASRETTSRLCQLLGERLDERYHDIDLQTAKEIVIDAIQEVNAHIYNLSLHEERLAGMGTTLCLLYFHPEGVVYGNVGDSRIYRLREQKLVQISKDHSLLIELMEQGQLEAWEAINFPHKNIITRAIGTHHQVKSFTRICDLADQDLFLMCSDGLSDLIETKKLEEILNQKQSLKQTTHQLVDEAKRRGGIDNITVVIAKVQELHGSSHLPG